MTNLEPTPQTTETPETTKWDDLSSFTLDDTQAETTTQDLNSITNPEEFRNTEFTIITDLIGDIYENPDHYANPNDPQYADNLTETLVSTFAVVDSSDSEISLEQAFAQVAASYSKLQHDYERQGNANLAEQFFDKANIASEWGKRYAEPKPAESQPVTEEPAIPNENGLDPGLIS